MRGEADVLKRNSAEIAANPAPVTKPIHLKVFSVTFFIAAHFYSVLPSGYRCRKHRGTRRVGGTGDLSGEPPPDGLSGRWRKYREERKSLAGHIPAALASGLRAHTPF